MDIIKEYITTLVAMLVFITAIELIAPDNSLKKYLKFIMGLILISVLLTPIIKFFTGGEKMVSEAIDKYEKEFTSGEYTKSALKESSEDDLDARKKSFISNYNKNCEELLKDKYKDMEFVCNLDCEVDFSDYSYTVNVIKIKVRSNNVKRIEKVVIGEEENNKEEDEVLSEIKSFLSKELEVGSEKIEVIYF